MTCKHNSNAQLETHIGHTPIVLIKNIVKDCPAKISIKLEYFNPASSIKDRPARGMIDDAEERGLLRQHSTPPMLIVEPTSGNTGIGLALLSSLRGYKLILTMPESMSEERKNLLRGMGAELRLTPAKLGMDGAVAEARKILTENPSAIMLDQFSNPANSKAHYMHTGPEIFKECNAMSCPPDIFVASVGTGGTISGVGRYLKEQNPSVKIYAVEPAESPLLSEGRSAAHLIQGIGTNFIPSLLDQSVIDGIITVQGREAIAMTKRLIKEEGILAGISSGCNVYAAIKLAMNPENKGKHIVTIACDTAERYLSTDLFAS